MRGKPLVYLDNAATSQKPRAVIDAVSRYYGAENANIHRGVHYLSERATLAYDGVRERVAAVPERGVAQRDRLHPRHDRGDQPRGAELRAEVAPAGDEILITEMEHHSNIVPWQLLAAQTGARCARCPSPTPASSTWTAFERLLAERTRLVAVAHLSNVLGHHQSDPRMIAACAHERGIVALVDGAQSAPHLPVDVQALDCDFFAFSGHKLFGPTGIGVLYGREVAARGDAAVAGRRGHDRDRDTRASTWARRPARFEAGTPPIAEVVGLGRGDRLRRAGSGAPRSAPGRRSCSRTPPQRVGELDGVRIIGTAREKASVLSFVVDGVHPHDVGAVLDDEGIAIRAGHHCAQPVMRRFGVPATARASFAVYNTRGGGRCPGARAPPGPERVRLMTS